MGTNTGTKTKFATKKHVILELFWRHVGLLNVVVLLLFFEVTLFAALGVIREAMGGRGVAKWTKMFIFQERVLSENNRCTSVKALFSRVCRFLEWTWKAFLQQGRAQELSENVLDL